MKRIVKELFSFRKQSESKNPSLVVGWSGDAGKLGLKVIDYLKQKLVCERYTEIEPTNFFYLGGVPVENNVIQFPEATFYTCQTNNLVMLISDNPYYDHYRFLNTILDIAEYHCKIKELYAIGSMISLAAHSEPRELIFTANSQEMKNSLNAWDSRGVGDYTTPPDQRPTLNSFLLWLAKKRNIPGINIWVPIPYYLVAVDDPLAQKKLLEFFNDRFDLNIDFSEMMMKIKNHSEKINDIRTRHPEIDAYIGKVENNIRLSEEENEKLVKEIEKLLHD